jgi:hypothetical protein
MEASGASYEDQGLVEVFEYWQKPGRFPGTERTPEKTRRPAHDYGRK